MLILMLNLCQISLHCKNGFDVLLRTEIRSIACETHASGFSLPVRKQVLPIEDEDVQESESGNKLKSGSEKKDKSESGTFRQRILPEQGAGVTDDDKAV